MDTRYHRKGVGAILYQNFLDGLLGCCGCFFFFFFWFKFIIYLFISLVMDECDVKAVLVDTSPSNSAAKNFFKRAGFKMVANHVFMEKQLLDLLS